MMSNTTAFAMPSTLTELWHGNFEQWFMTSGLHIVMLLIGSVLAVRFITWASQRITRRIDARFTEGDALVRSEATKHRQAMASVIAWVSIGVIYVVVVLEILNVLNLPMNTLDGPAAVLGAGLGFGARGVIEDMLAGFLIIAEKQYGLGDLVRLELSSTAVAEGTVEDVTLRVTRVRASDGEAYTIPNGKVVKTTNLSKDWARAVVDVPVPTTADLSVVNDVLHEVCETAHHDDQLGKLLLDAPSVMGVESIEVDAVNLRMVARTLPGRQFEAGRKLRASVVRALARAGIVTVGDHTPAVEGFAPAARLDAAEDETHDLSDKR
jgi:small conductance mechanosensitive channel